MREDTPEATPCFIHRQSARYHHPTGGSGSKRSPQSKRRRPHRADLPLADANDLALRHRDNARAVAANFYRRTGYPMEDLEQTAMVCIILEARRYEPDRGGFRPFARRYANGEVQHFLRVRGFQIKVPPKLAGDACHGAKAAGRWCCQRGGGPGVGGG
ncbi:MAG: sigma factor [Cyanobacteriota bacterium]